MRLRDADWIRSRSRVLSNSPEFERTYYILFAVIGGSTSAMIVGSLVTSVFLVLALLGFRRNPWVVVAALAGHGIFDFCHHLVIRNPGVPVWWPGFCLTFDIVAAGFLAMLLMRRSGFALKVSRS